MNGRNFFASLIMLAALASAGFAQTLSQSCPNRVTFGAHPSGPFDRSVQAQVDVTYFTSDDPNAFISERAGIYRSASNTVQGAEEFAATLRGLERGGLARIQKRQSATSYMGETAALNLERDAVNVNGGTVNASIETTVADYALDRETEISVTRNVKRDGDYYRLNLLSWFVDATRARGGFKTVDYDASMLLKPGQTLIVKLFSDFEIRRGGAARKYMAVTLRSAGPVAVASALEAGAHGAGGR
ncbi:MAG: hypothetical protein M3348_00690 [Acidobacteriota bacterium]|nr:hypothetical protein [Acidobacteriota bacterium]